MKLKRCIENPILKPNPENVWESIAVFNPSVVKVGKKFIMLYRAISKVRRHPGDYVYISSIGKAESKNGIHFENREIFFGPEYGYEACGCEDPRVCRYKNKYIIFYTAVSNIPPSPKHVRLAIATTEDFKEYEKHGLFAPFNSKAGVLFPEKIKDKIAVLFTYYPDIPPSKIVIAYFDSLKDLLNPTDEYWNEWRKYPEFEEKYVVISGDPIRPFVEVGSQPILTGEGWLLFLPEIIYKDGNFHSFRISAMLLDLEDPKKIVAMTKKPLLVPEVWYEKDRTGFPYEIAMPTGAVVVDDLVYVYYGASDKYICAAYCELDKLVNYLIQRCKA